MSKSGSGFDIGTIIFCIIMYNVFFSCDDEDTTVVEDNKPTIIEQVSEELKPEIEQVMAIAKDVRNKVLPWKETQKAKNGTTQKANERPITEVEKIKPIEDDDLYGSTADRY